MDFSKINELKPYDLNCNIFDVYSYDGLSMQELLCQFFTKINECVKTSNETTDIVEWLVSEGVKQEVALKLNDCLNDGTFKNLVNVTLFENLNKRIDNVNSQLECKANVNDVFTMANMGQDIKEAMTGGSVAVVGKDTILTENIIDNQVTPSKTNFIKEYVNLADKNNINLEKYWSSHLETVIESGGSNVGTLPVIQLKGGCTYEMSRINSGFCWVIDDVTGKKTRLSEHGGFVDFKRGGLNLKRLTVSNNSKLYITVVTNLYYSDIMVVEGKLPFAYKEFNQVYNYEINNIPVNGIYNEFVYIGVGKEFSSLAEFIKRLPIDNSFDELHQLTIVLDDGEHYLDTEFNIPEYVNIISASGNPDKCKVIYSPTNVSDYEVSIYSALKMERCNNKLKGIHFIGKNCRYVVHPESSGMYKDTFIEIENCIFEHLTNDLGRWDSQYAWGEGSSSGNMLMAKNCTFISHAPNSFAYSVHNNINFEKPMLYKFDNCHFYSYGYGSCFRCEGMNSGTDDRVYLNNCELNGNIMLTNSLSIKVYAMGTSHVCSSSNNYFETNSQAIYNDFTKMIKNGTAETIPAGTIVCYDNANDKIRVMTDTDTVDILAGFTIGDTGPNELAFVVTDGWYRYTDDFTIWKKFGVVDGKLDSNAENKVGMVVGGGFVRIKSNI